MRTTSIVIVITVAITLTACSGSSPVTTSDAARTSAPASQAGAPSGSAAPGSSMAMAGDTTEGSTALPAPAGPVEAGLQLEALLGQHAVLVSDLMRARIRSDDDLAQSADAALTQNTAAMGSVLRPIAGAQAATAFEKLWATHIQSLFNYSRGLATKDRAVQNAARTELVEYEDELADFFVAGSGGRFTRPKAHAAAKMHIDHLLAGADAYAAGDYATSADYYRTSYSHTFDLGVTLAHVLLPPSVAKKLDTPELQLRTALTKLLAEHVALVVAAMRAATGSQADFAGIGKQLNGNTTDLAKAMEGLFGRAAGEGFESRWSDHVDNLMAYTRATVAKDSAGQEKARLELRAFENSFAAFLNTATQNRVGEPVLAQAYVMHDRALLAEIDAYTAQNFTQAQDLSGQIYVQMFSVAGSLADAIGATLARRLPKGGSQTGGGGMADSVEGRALASRSPDVH